MVLERVIGLSLCLDVCQRVEVRLHLLVRLHQGQHRVGFIKSAWTLSGMGGCIRVPSPSRRFGGIQVVRVSRENRPPTKTRLV